MTAPVTEDTIRALAPLPDDLWPAAEQEAALAALLRRIEDPAGDPAGPYDASDVDLVPVRRRRWSWGAAVAAAVVVLLVGVGAVLVALHRSSHDGAGPAATSSPTVAATNPPDPLLVIPIDHTGAYHYTSRPLVVPTFSHGTAIDTQVVGATLAEGPGLIVGREVPADDNSPLVITVDFSVTAYDAGAELQVRLSEGGSEFSQIGPECRVSSGGCGAATEPGNVRPS